VNNVFGRTMNLIKSERAGAEQPKAEAASKPALPNREAEVVSKPAATAEVSHQFDRSKISQYNEVQVYKGTSSEEAIELSNIFVKYRSIATPFRDGTRLTAGTGAEFTLAGVQRGSPHASVVIDKAADPIYRLTIEDAHAKFGHLKDDTPKLAEALSKYVAQTLNAHKLTGEQLMADVEQILRQHPEGGLLLGEFIRQGKGMCLQQAALLKGLGESFDKIVTIKDGTINYKGKTEHHTWPEFQMPDKTMRIYDPAQRANNVPVYRAAGRG
jgi:hypothetical protein